MKIQLQPIAKSPAFVPQLVGQFGQQPVDQLPKQTGRRNHVLLAANSRTRLGHNVLVHQFENMLNE